MKAARPDIKTRAKYWQAGKPAIVTYTLIVINIAVFIGLGLWYDLGGMLAGSLTDAHRHFALNSVFIDGQPVVYGLSDGTQEISDGNDWYRLVTSGFLHFGIIHLAFNMYFLYVLGNMIEPQLGRVKFILLYGASLLGGSAGVILIDQGSFTAGASGAVFGLLGATAIGIWQQGINPFRTQIGTLLLINLGLTFFVGGISIGGHIGGLVAGTLCGFVMMAPGYKAFPAWSRYATPVVVGVAVRRDLVRVRRLTQRPDNPGGATHLRAYNEVMALRTTHIDRIRDGSFDTLIIGGGINGAVTAASLAGRGASVALIDRGDFASFTSQASSNLVWGGFKYLENYELWLVFKLCQSRNRLMRAYRANIKEIGFYAALDEKGPYKPWFAAFGALGLLDHRAVRNQATPTALARQDREGGAGDQHRRGRGRDRVPRRHPDRQRRPVRLQLRPLRDRSRRGCGQLRRTRLGRASRRSVGRSTPRCRHR